MNPYVRPATLDDIRDLAPRLRAADVAEIKAASGREPLEALEYGLAVSDETFVIVFNEQPVGIFGVADLGNGMGSPWMMATDELPKIAIPFLRQARTWVERLGRNYRLFINYVDARNEVHIRWLRWLGFTFLRVIPDWGHERRPFYEFVRINRV